MLLLVLLLSVPGLSMGVMNAALLSSSQQVLSDLIFSRYFVDSDFFVTTDKYYGLELPSVQSLTSKYDFIVSDLPLLAQLGEEKFVSILISFNLPFCYY